MTTNLNASCTHSQGVNAACSSRALYDGVSSGYSPVVTSDTIREMLTRDPFEPFRIVTSGGESFVVRDPLTVALLKSEVFIAQPKSDRRTFIPLLHVVTVESIGHGHAPRRK